MGITDRSESRDGYAVRVLAVHTSEGGGAAQVLRDAGWWTGSSHAIADKAGVLLTPAEGCVPYDRASWTLRSGNRWSENIELVGYAKSTRAQWLADEAELNACARWLAVRSKARGIPLVKLTPAEYRAGKWGVIGHHDHTVGYSDGTHWDPGPNFPWDVVLDKARAYASGQPQEDDMPLTTADIGNIWLAATVDPVTGKPSKAIDLLKAAVSHAYAGRVAAEQGKAIAEAQARLGRALSLEDVQRIAEATAAEVAEDLSEGYDLTATPKGDTDPA